MVLNFKYEHTNISARGLGYCFGPGTAIYTLSFTPAAYGRSLYYWLLCPHHADCGSSLRRPYDRTAALLTLALYGLYAGTAGAGIAHTHCGCGEYHLPAFDETLY